MCLRTAKSADKPDYMKLNKILRSMIVDSSPQKVLRYDWLERAAKHLEQQRREQSLQHNSSPTDAITESDNKNIPLGAIDIDQDKNFAMRDDLSAGEDDESNIEEGHTMEVMTDVDALPQSIVRLQSGFNTYFLQDIKSASPGKKITNLGRHGQPS